MLERGYTDMGDRKKVIVYIEINIQRLLIEIGRGEWSEGIRNCLCVRG